jgi:DNA-binding NtrC family response regulator
MAFDLSRGTFERKTTMTLGNHINRIETPAALVAEEDERTRSRISDYLRMQGYDVLEARTSVEAILLAVDSPYRIDALFTSLSLRKYCNGLELAACLRATRPEMAVFYLAEGGSPSEEVTRELVQGLAGLILKPLAESRLSEALEQVEKKRVRSSLVGMPAGDF